jgi:CubicO group peptidase (beta-lactamase class C family)
MAHSRFLLFLGSLLLLSHSISARSRCITFSNNREYSNQLARRAGEAAKPGYSVIVQHGDSIIAGVYAGRAETQSNRKITKDSRFYIASIAKTMTAAAVLLLAKEKKLHLDDRIRTYFPDLPAFMKDIRIYHLLTHTSGLIDYYDVYGERPRGFTNDSIVQFVRTSDSLLFEPGVDYSYSNTGYVMLAEIIEKVSGMSYARFLDQKFFGPLHMDQTVVIDQPGMSIPDRVIGYVTDSTGRLQVSDYTNTFVTGSGGIYSTIGDLSIWVRALWTGKLLSGRWRDLMLDFPTTLRGSKSYFGMGWTNESFSGKDPDFGGVPVYGSLGVLQGFRSGIFVVPDADLTLIFLSNSGTMGVDPMGVIRQYLTNR